VLELRSRFESKRRLWRLEDVPAAGMDHFLQASAIMALENTFSLKWAMTAGERRAYFEQLAKSEPLREAAAALPPTNRYYSGVLEALFSGRYGRAQRLIRLKCLAKRYLKGAFFRLKNRGK